MVGVEGNTDEQRPPTPLISNGEVVGFWASPEYRSWKPAEAELQERLPGFDGSVRILPHKARTCAHGASP